MTNIDRVMFLPKEKIRDLQNKKLHHFITRRLYPFSPHYRRLFDSRGINPDDIRTADDLRRIPFTSKQDLRDAIEKDPARGNIDFCLQPNEETIKNLLPKTELLRFLLIKILKGKAGLKAGLEREYKPIFLTATSGTTYQPIAFLYSSYDMENLRIYGKRLIEIMGIKKDRTTLNVFPYAPHLAFWQTVFAGFAGNVFVLSTGGGKTIGTEGNLRAILKIKPQFLIGVPSYVYHILKVAREENLDLNFLNRVVLGAGRVPQGFKAKICKLLNEMGASDVRVSGTYGFTEARAAWAECLTDISVSSGYHTYPDKEIFEVIDPDTGEPKGEGEDGELVYSSIDARGTCVLRYRTGDLVKGGISYEPCPHCGRTVPRISNDIVRASNVKNVQFSKIKSSLVNLNDLEHLLDNRDEIDEWQIEITKKNNDPYEVDELILHVCLLCDVDKEKFSHILNDQVMTAADISFNRINFVAANEIQRRIEIEKSVKAKKIVDKRPAE